MNSPIFVGRNYCSAPKQTMCYHVGTSIDMWTSDASMHTSLYAFLCVRLLILAADVESNPGPSSETQTILDAIAESNSKTLKQISEVKNEIASIKSGMSCVKSEISSMKSRIDRVEDCQIKIAGKVNRTEHKIDQ